LVGEDAQPVPQMTKAVAVPLKEGIQRHAIPYGYFEFVALNAANKGHGVRSEMDNPGQPPSVARVVTTACAFRNHPLGG
jgi:hypothetical protein